MAQDLHKIEAAYDSIAREYAEAFQGEHEQKPMDREMLRRFMREMGERRPVWDLGCGPGQTARFLNDLGLPVSGLDLSSKILEQARASHPGIRFQKGSLLNLKFDSGSIAGVVSFYAIVHFSKGQTRNALREIHRALQPSGLLLLTFHIGEETMRLDEFLGKQVDIDFMFFTTDFIRGCLEKCGFEGIDIIERDPYPGVEYQSRRAYVFAVKPA